MTASTARVFALLEILQTGGVRTVPDLARRLHVDERTIRRSVAHLADLGVPVESIRGRYGGYRLASGYRMPPLMLTNDEALAVVLGLESGRRSGPNEASAMARESASAKIRRVLPDVVARKLDAFTQAVSFTTSTSASNNEGLEQHLPTPDTGILLSIAEASRDRRPVEIEYADRSGRVTQRSVLVFGLVAHSSHWYITGRDSTGDDLRTFRLDRIRTVALGEGSYEVPADYDAAEAVLAGLASTPWAHSVSLRVDDRMENVRRHFPAGLATLTPLPGDDSDAWVRVQFQAERVEWIPSILAAMGRPFVVEEPESLRESILALAAVLTAGAQSVNACDPV